MGYRSEMYALVHGSDLIPFLAILEETGLDEWFGTKNFKDEDLDEEGYARFTAESLKWYSGYSDVDAVTAIFLKSKHSVLLRVGEDQCDGEDIEFYTNNQELTDRFSIYHHVDVEF